MNRTLVLLLVIVVAFQGFTILAPAKSALFSTGSPPKVVCVPFHGVNLGVPHDAWVGNEAVLKGTAHDPDGDDSLDFFMWDFGDGYSIDWAPVTDPYVIEARHIYNGTRKNGTPYGPGDYFTAWLYVNDTDGNVGMDSYFIAIRDVSTPEKKLPVEVNVAIDDGLWWLHKQPSRYSSNGTDYATWSYSSPWGTFTIAPTAESVLAFEIQSHQPIGDPDDDPYVENVRRGLNYVLSQTRVQDISLWGPGTNSPYGDPDTNGNDIGIDLVSSGREVYEFGIVMMAIAASGDPNLVATTGPLGVIGRTYREILTDMVDLCAWGQNDAGVGRGGWRYGWNYGSSDNSVSQWPMMGLEAAETNWGISAPSFVKTELDTHWLTYSQNAAGGFGYEGSSDPTIGRTGTGIIGLSYVGLLSNSSSRIQNAINWLDGHWAGGYGSGVYYDRYALMKGMRTAHPEIVMVGSHNWYAEYARYLVDNQQADDGWSSDAYGGRILGTDWAILILSPVFGGDPVAVPGPDVMSYPPLLPLKFDASMSFHMDPTKRIVLYEWDFEDDGIWDYNGTDPITWHPYPAYYVPPDNTTIDWDLTEKNYTARLRVTDNSDEPKRNDDTRIVGITRPPWKPVADPNGDYYGMAGVPVQLNGSGSYAPESRLYNESHPWYRNITKYEWDLDNDGYFNDSYDPNPVWTWLSNGTFSVGLRVTAFPPVDEDHDYDTKSATVRIGELRTIQATVEYCPLILNLGSKGNWGSSYIELPEGYNVSEINVSTIRVNGVVPPDSGVPPVVGDYDGDGHQDLKVKLNRTALSQFILGKNVTIGTVELTLTGQLFDGTQFKGSDTIRVRMAGDTDMDGRVNIIDCIVAANYFGSTVTCMDEGAIADENEDSRINVLDLILIARNFGKIYPQP